MNNKSELKVFIVDDDPVCRELYRQYMRNIGIENTELFDNGQDCINALTYEPDIILLDHQMTPVDGLETLKKIKRFNPDIYLIFISGQEDMQIAVNALKYGAFDYVIKGENNEAAIGDIVEKILSIREMLRRKDNGTRWSKLFSLFSF